MKYLASVEAGGVADRVKGFLLRKRSSAGLLQGRSRYVMALERANVTPASGGGIKLAIAPFWVTCAARWLSSI